MKSIKWIVVIFLCGSLAMEGCKVFKKNDCGCPTMNKKRMH
jgi:hypothetical protein